jgi:uncharacterized protein
MDKYAKLEFLISEVKKLGKVAVAFSGGVDSTFLLKVSHDAIGDNVIAITVHSSLHPHREYMEAVGFVNSLGIEQKIIEFNDSDLKLFSDNPSDRCYLCKKEIFKRILDEARNNGIIHVADGSNFDDLSDYRPGAKALKELNIISPLKDSGFTKEEIRFFSREMGLPTWDKPAFACLASRIPYGSKITVEKLNMIEKAEQYLFDLGFRQVRVRCHDETARIEVAPQDRIRFIDPVLMDNIYEAFKEIGFLYTSLDLKGYRQGSMNEGLGNKGTL